MVAPVSLRLGRTDDFRIALTLRATAIASDALRAASQERHADSVQQFSVLYTTLLHADGRQLRPGRQISEFAETMAALGEGFALHAIEGLPHVRTTGPDGTSWTLFGVSVWCLIEGFTELDTSTDQVRSASTSWPSAELQPTVDSTT